MRFLTHTELALHEDNIFTRDGDQSSICKSRRRRSCRRPPGLAIRRIVRTRGRRPSQHAARRGQEHQDQRSHKYPSPHVHPLIHRSDRGRMLVEASGAVPVEVYRYWVPAWMWPCRSSSGRRGERCSCSGRIRIFFRRRLEGIDRRQIEGCTGCLWRCTGCQQRTGLQRDRELQAVRRVRTNVQIKGGRLGAVADQDPLPPCNSRGKTVYWDPRH